MENAENADLCCVQCNFKCYKKSNWLIHCKTRKHLYGLSGNDMEIQKNAENNNSVHICKCGKEYRTNSGLWKHIKNCGYKEDSNKNIITVDDTIHDHIDKDLIIMLIKQNTELQNMMMDVVKNGTTNITQTNSHNKTFNLQVFLNETCKDAMNIMDFVDSIKLQLSDFERVGEVGFVNGISDIIIKNLKQLDITERPIHCTDKKREIMYVKDENKWEKEDDTNKKVRRAIKYIANKNINLMDAYKALHPDCQKSHSIYSDSYNKFVIEALGGSGNEDCDNEDRIISRLSKVVTIEKD